MTSSEVFDVLLSKQQKALLTAVRSMVEEHLDFIVLYLRWQRDENWAIYKAKFIELAMLYGAPRFIAKLAMPSIHKQVLRVLDCQGMGRHSVDEVQAIGLQLFGLPRFVIRMALAARSRNSESRCVSSGTLTSI